MPYTERTSNKIATERINNFFKESTVYDCYIMVGLIEYDKHVYYTLFIQKNQTGNSLESIYKNMVLAKNFQISTGDRNDSNHNFMVIAIIMEIQNTK